MGWLAATRSGNGKRQRGLPHAIMSAIAPATLDPQTGTTKTGAAQATQQELQALTERDVGALQRSGYRMRTGNEAWTILEPAGGQKKIDNLHKLYQYAAERCPELRPVPRP